jgi:hypothetical protein
MYQCWQRGFLCGKHLRRNTDENELDDITQQAGDLNGNERRRDDLEPGVSQAARDRSKLSKIVIKDVKGNVTFQN